MYIAAIILFVHSTLGNGIELEYHISPPDKIFLRTKYDTYSFHGFKYNGGPEHKIPSNSTYHMIDKLQPCTKYNFEFTGTANNSSKKYQTFTKEITTGVGPNLPIEILKVTSDSTQIWVKSKFSQIDCIDFLEMAINENIETFPKHEIKKLINIGRIDPCTKYNLVINIIISGHRYLLHQGTFITKPVEIKQVENIYFNTKTNLLAWVQPLLSAFCVSFYSLTLKTNSLHRSNEEILIQTKQSFYELNMLQACSVYNVTIIPNKRDDLNSTFTFTTGYAEPNAIENIMTNLQNTFLREIKWDAPIKNVACISKYYITINNKRYQTRDNSLILEKRLPCEKYEVSVCSSSSLRNCLNKTFHFDNVENVQIGNISNIKIHTVNKTTTITWLPPAVGSNCVKHYLVELFKDRNIVHSSSTNFTRIEFDKLVPCAAYEVRLESYSRLNQSISRKSIDKFQIEPQKPEQPSQLELVSSTSTSLTLKSEYKNVNDNCKIEAVQFDCQLYSQNISFASKNINGDNKFQVTFINLKPLSNYSCQVSIKNSVQWSDAAKTNKTFLTETPLDAAFNFHVSNTTSRSMHISWNNIQSVSKHNKLLIITKRNHNYELPKDCTFKNDERKFIIESHVSKQQIENLEPATNYSLQIVTHMAGENQKYTKIIYGSTLSDVPPNVLNAQVAEIKITPSVTITWDLPCQLNGTVHQIDLQFIGVGIKSEPVHNFVESIPINSVNLNQTYMYTNRLINPDYRYTVTIITIRNQNNNVSSRAALVHFLSPPKMPDVYNLPKWGSIKVDMNTATQIEIIITSNFKALINLADNISALITNRKECGDFQPAYKLYDLDHKIYEPQINSLNQNCTEEYRTLIQLNRLIIGDCVNIKNNCTHLHFKSGSSYQIALSVNTPSGFADTNPISFETPIDASKILLIILLILVTCLIIRICVGATFWFYKRRTKDNRIIHETNENVIIDEYTAITEMNLNEIKKSVGIKHGDKNRYSDIIPYDFNRVVLPPNNFCTVDYINASFINGFNHNHKFIATQGPTINTAYDYWRMVMEMKCHKIVMVTELVENGMNKCFQYYPNLNENVTFNDIMITNADETYLGIFVRRELILRKGLTEHLVIQYQFLKWADDGCPENEMDLINFVEFVNNENRTPYPIVVHCSAGVGRTGTFIALDILMEGLNHKKPIDIYRTVGLLRMQRTSSVSTIGQYKFLYACVAQYVNQNGLQGTE